MDKKDPLLTSRSNCTLRSVLTIKYIYIKRERERAIGGVGLGTPTSRFGKEGENASAPRHFGQSPDLVSQRLLETSRKRRFPIEPPLPFPGRVSSSALQFATQGGLGEDERRYDIGMFSKMRSIAAFLRFLRPGKSRGGAFSAIDFRDHLARYCMQRRAPLTTRLSSDLRPAIRRGGCGGVSGWTQVEPGIHAGFGVFPQS